MLEGSVLQWFVVVVGGSVAALAVHELGHLIAAGAFGASNIRLRPGWPAFRVEADLPDEPGALVVFLAAGAVANIGAAAALWGFRGWFAVAAVLQVAMAAVTLIPVGSGDGAQLWRLLRQRDGV